MPGMFNPFDPSQTTGMSQRDILEAQSKMAKWQQSRIDSDQAVVASGQKLTTAQTNQATASAEAAAATKAYTDLMAQTEGKPNARAAAEAQLTELANKAQIAHDKEVTATNALTTANQEVADAKSKQYATGLEPPPDKAKGKELTPDEKSAALGKGLVKGVFEELGFPDVFGKPFTEWGAYKLAMGGLGYGAGLLQNMTQLGPGNPIPGANPGNQAGASPGGGSGLMGLLGGLGSGFGIPGDPGAVAAQPFAMPGSEAPANVPLASGAQNHLTVVNNNSGIMAPPQAQQTIADAAHTTAAPQLHGGGGLPGPG
jgi:hypothetical protein